MNTAGASTMPILESTSTDLGPLAWVHGEVRKSLENAAKAVHRHQLGHAPGQAGDEAELKAAVHHLHQAAGALQMVGQGGAGRLASGMEWAVQRLLREPTVQTASAVAAIERAGFALTDFLARLMGGRPAPALGLFPHYRDMLELAGAERIHPADLWPEPWSWPPLPRPEGVPPLVLDAQVRAGLDRDLLPVVKSGHAESARRLAALCLRLMAGQAPGTPSAGFWLLAGAFFEALGAGVLPADAYARRTASRVMLQYAALARGAAPVADRLGQDLLFFCAQARVPTPPPGPLPLLTTVRRAWGLGRGDPVDYEQRRFGRFDPALLAQARRRAEAAKECWSAISDGDLNRLRPAADSFAQLGESLMGLYPAAAPLVQAFDQVLGEVIHRGEPPSTELALEVATALLHMEAAFDDLDPQDRELAERIVQLAGRIERARSGAPSEPLAPWMEALYHRVSDRQSLGTVVDELRAHLGELEKSLDQFFRRPGDGSVLRAVPAQLTQMRGVLSVLGLDQAARAVQRMREDVEQLLAEGAGQGQIAPEAPGVERLGHNLGALGFLIDMLAYQPALARRLFVFDELAGRLDPLMGRQGAPAPAAPPQDESPAGDDESARAVDAQIAQRLAEVAAPAPRTAPEPVVAPALEAFSRAAETWQTPPMAPASPGPARPEAALPPGMDVAELDEDDLRAIFLDEAREVLQSARVALQSLAQPPGSGEELTVLRRAFHTLKGSARMVGLAEVGDAAWCCEQVLNTWLAEQRRADAPLMAALQGALPGFAAWIEAIAAGGTPPPSEPWLAPMRALIAAPEPVALPASPRHLEAAKSADDPQGPRAVPPPPPAPAQALPIFEPDFEATTLPAPLEPLPAPVEEPDLLPDLDLDLGGPTRPADLDYLLPDPPPSPRVPPPLPGFGHTRMEEELAFDEPPTLPAPIRREDEEAEFDDQTAADFERTAQAEPAEESVPLAPGYGVDFELSMVRSEATDDDGLAAADKSLPSGGAGEQASDAPQPAPADDSVAAPPVPELEAAQAPAVPHPYPEPEPEPQPEPAQAVAPEPAPPGSDPLPRIAPDEVRLVGGLRIPQALYNVYLSEAEDWSRQLAERLAAWAEVPERRLPDDAVAAAHSLAGSSATVGFALLSELARLVEQVLQHLQGEHRAGTAEAAVLVEAAQEIRRLLHQFAAGFVKAPAAGLPDRLRALLAVPVAEPMSPGTPASALGPDVALEPEDELGAVQDAVDHELFPIFEEEAAELLPELSRALRAWAAEPADGDARAQVLRALHTLKGSARLAGAMRLGQRAHQMESALEPLGLGEAVRGALEQALGRLDALQAEFDRLRAADSADEARRQQQAADSVAAEHSAPALRVETGAAALADRNPEAPGAESAAVADRRAEGRRPPGLEQALAAALPIPTPTVAAAAGPLVRIRAQLLDRLMAEAGEVTITRGRVEASVEQLRGALGDLTSNLQRLRQQLRDLEVQAESQMQSRQMQSRDAQGFDPLEFDRFTRVQELTRMMAESVDDVAAVHRTLQRTVQVAEDGLQTQARQTRELQRSLLRTRMVAFDNLAERLYRVVRQASKETGKPVTLDLLGGEVEMDRGVLDRIAPAFEHLLRNAVVHGIEPPVERERAGKPATGQLRVEMRQDGNDIAIRFADDGGGLRAERIRDRAETQGLIAPGAPLDEQALAELVFRPGFTTANEVSELAGRGIGMDVVRAEVTALGGRIETRSTAGQGTEFRLVLPLTTAVTQVVMLRAGDLTFGVPASLVELVQRAGAPELAQAYAEAHGGYGGESLPFYWAGALLQASDASEQPPGRANTVVVVRSAAQRVLLHVDEVLGSQEVVVKNLGPQLSRVPGLVGVTVLASGAVVMIHNPVVLGTLHGGQARRRQRVALDLPAHDAPGHEGRASAQVPLVMVVDDSITVRRVTQRLLQREGWRVALAADGLQALELLQGERPALVLSDIEMPRMDGFDLVRNIRADAQLANLPVVMITSRIAGKHREHAQALGVDHYLGKPYGEDELLALVRRYAAPAPEEAEAPAS